MRKFTISVMAFIIFIPISMNVKALYGEKHAIIIEVDGDPTEHKQYIKHHYPFVEIISVYEKLFNGIAIKVYPHHINRLSTMDFIKQVYPVITYEALIPKTTTVQDDENIVLPSNMNQTKFTGKGVKVGVIDTGIDYKHMDLASNFSGGYDLVDLDDDPMETTIDKGMPTNHGTHVAGIIAANGLLKGVAPEASIYAYRALGPGGIGSSIQVIAAMEQAINDGVDIINLSLGNSVNGPDYPTSMAVNRAIELGVMVVIANGNDGPDHWTVGSPATASKALSVGALKSSEKVPHLYESTGNKLIPIDLMHGSVKWDFKRDYKIVDLNENPKDVRGNIAITSRGEETFSQKAIKAQEKEAIALLIYNHEEGSFQGAIENENMEIQIPVAAISKNDGEWLIEKSQDQLLYIMTKFKQQMEGIATFSSRGPVTMNWEIKPDIIAPGTNIMSTVPGGYQALQGTSMAAPHVAGAIAVMKEAKPYWTNEQIIGAIKTSAKRLLNDHGIPFDPIEQGMGEIQLEKAIQTKTIIHNSLLNFGKMNKVRETNFVDITIENLSSEPLEYFFEIPKKETGISWKLPQSFTVNSYEKKTVTIEMNTTKQLLENGIHQGWLTLNGLDEKFYLPYLFVHQTADFPKTTGFQFSLKFLNDQSYIYKVYVIDENVRKVEVHLYDPYSLIYDRKLLQINDVKIGLNEGEIRKKDLGSRGIYQAIVRAELSNGQVESYETMIFIE